MKNLALIAFPGCSLFVLPAASQVTSLECIARGASPTATGRYPQIVQNGDFRVTGDARDQEIGDIGDALDEQTRWTCDLSRQLDISTVETFEVRGAVLNLILITKEDGSFNTDKVSIVGLPWIVDPTIQSMKGHARTNVNIDLLDHYDSRDIILNLKENDGKLSFHYSDDSTVSYAALNIDLRPTASQLTGVEIIKSDTLKSIDEIAVGESFFVTVTFENMPNVDCPSVTVRNTTSGESIVVPTLEEWSPTAQPDMITTCITVPVEVVPTIVQP